MRVLSPVSAPPQLPALRPLTAAIANRDYAPAEIVFWGDSVLEGSTLAIEKQAAPYRFQEMLRGAFPTAGVRGGRGFLPPYYESPSLANPCVVDLSANTGGTSVAVKDVQSGFGARGYQLKFGAALIYTEEFTDFDVWYAKGPFGVGFNVYVDGIVQGSAIGTLNGGGVLGGFRARYTGFAPGEHVVKIQTVDNSGFVSVINGVTFFHGDRDKGIHVINASKSGAAAKTGTTASFGPEHFKSMTTVGNVCAVGIQLITNDAVFFSSPAAYKTDILNRIAEVNTAMTGVPFVLIGFAVSEPNSSFIGGALYPEYIDAMQDAFESFTHGMFVNMSDFLGPKVSTDVLGLWSDSVHLSAKGHSLTADRLLWALNLNGGGTTVPVSNAFYPLAFSKNGTLTVSTAKSVIYNDTSAVWTFQAARAEVVTAPTGAGIVCQVKINGSNAFTVTIPSGATASGLVTPPVVQVPVGGKVSVDITQVGSTVAGADLSMTLTAESIV